MLNRVYLLAPLLLCRNACLKKGCLQIHLSSSYNFQFLCMTANKLFLKCSTQRTGFM
jgi:hypothetical protein